MRAARCQPRIARVPACTPEPLPQVLERDHPRPSKRGAAYQSGACLVLLTSTDGRHSRYKRLSAAAVDGLGLRKISDLRTPHVTSAAIFWSYTSAPDLDDTLTY